MRGSVLYTLVALMVLCAGDVGGQDEVVKKKPKAFNWAGAPLDIVIQEYADLMGRTVLMDPDVASVSALITLRTNPEHELTEEEAIFALDSVLAMHGVAVKPLGEKFLKVVKIDELRRENVDEIVVDSTSDQLGKSDKIISHMINLKHLGVEEADKIGRSLIHNYKDNVQLFERTNSMLVMDTEANIKRLLEILEKLDVPIESAEEPFIRPIKNAQASEIKAKLEEVIADHMQEQKAGTATAPRASTSGPPGAVRNPQTPPGVLRPPVRGANAANSKPATGGGGSTLVGDDISRGAIKGNVKIVADDRTNLLIIITLEQNMKFFDTLIDALDIATEPDVVVEVFQLEFAGAEDVAAMLNSFIGGGGSSEETSGSGAARAGGGADNSSSALESFVANRREARSAANAGDAQSLLGDVSAENIKILPDPRTNSIMVMASKADVQAISALIEKMDVTLAQVLVEAVILNVSLSDNLRMGFDWLQRSMIVTDDQKGGKPLFGFSGTGGGGADVPLDATSILSVDDLPGGSAGLTYYFTHFGLNIDAVLNAVATDSDVRIEATPVILTTDNTDAEISITDQIYIFQGSTIDQFGNQVPQTELQDVGLRLTVTPHVNKNRFVMMDIVQDIQSVTGEQEIEGTLWPTTSSRNLTANIGVQDKETIILGGLVQDEVRDSNSGVPYLRKIPLLGRFFSQNSDEVRRTELVVLITPYVLDTQDRAYAETLRRQRQMNLQGSWKRGWTGSKLAEPSEDEIREQKELEKLTRKMEKEKSGKEGKNGDSGLRSRDLENLDPALRERILKAEAEWRQINEGAAPAAEGENSP